MRDNQPLTLESQQNAILQGMKDGIKRILDYSHSLEHTKPEYLLTVSVADMLSKLKLTPYGGLKIELEKSTYEVTDSIIQSKTAVLSKTDFLRCARRIRSRGASEGITRVQEFVRFSKRVGHLLQSRASLLEKLRFIRVKKDGRLDIFASSNLPANPPGEQVIILVEIKRDRPDSQSSSFDNEIKKDVERLERFLISGRYSKYDLTAHLSFFTRSDEAVDNIKDQYCSSIDGCISVTVKQEEVDGESPQNDYIDDNGENHYYYEGISRLYVYCISMKLKTASRIIK